MRKFAMFAAALVAGILIAVSSSPAVAGFCPGGYC
jgi:hypothetical protein